MCCLQDMCNNNTISFNLILITQQLLGRCGGLWLSLFQLVLFLMEQKQSTHRGFMNKH